MRLSLLKSPDSRWSASGCLGSIFSKGDTEIRIAEGRDRHIEDIGYVCFYGCCDSFNISISIEAVGHFSLVRAASPRPLGFRSEIVIDPFYTVCRLIKVSLYRLSVNSVATHHIPEV